MGPYQGRRLTHDSRFGSGSAPAGPDAEPKPKPERIPDTRTPLWAVHRPSHRRVPNGAALRKAVAKWIVADAARELGAQEHALLELEKALAKDEGQTALRSGAFWADAIARGRVSTLAKSKLRPGRVVALPLDVGLPEPEKKAVDGKPGDTKKEPAPELLVETIDLTDGVDTHAYATPRRWGTGRGLRSER